MAAVGARRVVLVTLGWEVLPRSFSVLGADDALLREPVPGVLVDTPDGWVLLDTGFNPALLQDPALRRRFHSPDRPVTAVLPGGEDPLEAALDQVGLSTSDIATVAVSHLHNDHAGGIRHFAGSVPVHLQRAELDYGLANHPEPERHGIYRIDFDDPAIDWRLADGDCSIAPGVTAVLTAGHTPGHQSFVVELDEAIGGGGFVFAFDAADLTENIDEERAVGSFIDCPAEQTVDAIRRLKALAAERDLLLVPGHDPLVWPTLTDDLRRRWPVVGDRR
jgi:N-acyl homoserine lactone hydrolase